MIVGSTNQSHIPPTLKPAPIDLMSNPLSSKAALSDAFVMKKNATPMKTDTEAIRNPNRLAKDKMAIAIMAMAGNVPMFLLIVRFLQ